MGSRVLVLGFRVWYSGFVTGALNPLSENPLLVLGLGAAGIHFVGPYSRTSLGAWGISRGVKRSLMHVQMDRLGEISSCLGF